MPRLHRAIVLSLVLTTTFALADDKSSSAVAGLADPDTLVIDAFLGDLVNDKSFACMATPGVHKQKQKVLVLSGRIRCSSDDDAWLKEDRAHPGQEGVAKVIPRDACEDQLRRNSGKTVSLGAYVPGNSNVLHKPEPGELTRRNMEQRRPDVKAWVLIPYLPGYSEDRNTAVVKFTFGPTTHGAFGVCLLAKRDGRWVVKWKDLAYFL